MLKKASLAFGVVFVLIGILGFVSPLAPVGDDGMRRLLGIFMVDGLHNSIHLASGVVALIAAMNTKYARLYFQVFGVVYALVAVLGFFMSPILGILHVNLADNLLHVVIAASSLYLGFMFKDADDSHPVVAA